MRVSVDILSAFGLRRPETKKEFQVKPETDLTGVKKPPMSSKVSESPTLEDAYRLMVKLAGSLYFKFTGLQRSLEKEDIANGYFAYYLERGYHAKYNPEKAPFEPYLKLGMTRWCITQLRKLQFRVPTGETDEGGREVTYPMFRIISGDFSTQTGEDPETTILSEMDDRGAEDPLSALIVEELLVEIDDKPRGDVVGSSLAGKTRLSRKVVFEHVLAGYSLTHIAAMYNITRGRTAQITRQVREMLRERV